jgi:FtsP/CotA-like multicopper oxidase with cupredoxin domain
MRNQKTLTKTANLRRSPVSRACLTFAMTVAAVPAAFAGAGWGDSFDSNGAPIRVRTYYAHSPSGPRSSTVLACTVPIVPGAPASGATLASPDTCAAVDPVATIDTGAALRKFVDTLPGLTPAHASTLHNADGTTTSKYIPLAVASTWTNLPTAKVDDYYEIAVVEYKDKFHSDLANPTVLRGYVQIYPHYNQDGTKRVLTAAEKTHPLLDVKGNQIVFAGTTDGVYAYDNPHYLGPAIVATKGRAVRLKFYNFLPVGRFDGVNRNGDLAIPVDTTLPGAGYGPDGTTFYSQNRAEVHLHGGDTPWISDGTPHQWITPAGEANAAVAGTLANTMGANNPYLPEFLKGVSQQNVPDMPAPEAGAATYYFPNNQSGRLMFYHDHSFGLTRLNVYAGEAAPYVLADPDQEAIFSGANFPGVLDAIPLVIQDKTFVPKDIALQDGLWNNTNTKHGDRFDAVNYGKVAAKNVWGGESDLWYPHVYEINQDPNNATDGTNGVGRWDWGPFFWPVFPALYNIPSGAVDDVTLTPEAWMDTPVVNGVAYPTVTVDPTTTRFMILNAANDRMLNLSMFVADTTAGNVGPNGELTEVKMVPAVPQVAQTTPACGVDATGAEIPPTIGAACWPSYWPTDGRDGGVPDPATAGPAWHQIASEGGLLPKVATIEPSPMGYEYNRRSITVLNTYTYGLFLGNAERADVMVDFSPYAGKTLLVYNDSPAPVPAFDPRNDHWTGKPDESAVGSVETPKPGYGPNTRTVMQIVVRGAVAGKAFTPLNAAGLTSLETAVESAYFATQEPPVVAQAQYSGALKTTFSDSPNTDPASPGYGTGAKAFANIFTGSLQEPTFKFVPGDSTGAFSSIKIVNGGSGYVAAPNVNISGGNGTGAAAQATLRISSVTVTDPGSGYIIAPLVTFLDTSGAGAGADGTATLKVVGVNLANAGRNYKANETLTLTFAPPTNPTPAKGGVQAKATMKILSVSGSGAIRTLGPLTFATPLDAGLGYASAPGVTVSGGSGTTVATFTTVAGVGQVRLNAANPNLPATAGGGGYTNLDPTNLTITFATNTANVTAATAAAFGTVSDVTLTNSGTGYTAAPTITFTDPTGAPAPTVAATAQASSIGSVLVKSKAIQELFDPTYGRMNATLGIELPFTSALTQTTIPLGYVDPISEEFNDGETQIWKITHNGVDSHPVHFHLVNVQVINRIGWDGTVKPPQPNEYGWKETIKMHPLEDIMVAVRAKKPKIGYDFATKTTTSASFGLPLSVRMRDPSQPAGVPSGFTQIDPATGLPATIFNQKDNFGWEYVWHCHILGHEENDFMRAIKFNANEVDPAAPSGLARVGAALTWTDNSVSENRYSVSQGSLNYSTNNARYTFNATGTPIALLANANKATVATTSGLVYAVSAVRDLPNAKTVQGTSYLPAVTVAAPTGVAAAYVSATSARISWTDNSNNENRFVIEQSINGGAWTVVGTPTAANATSATVAVVVGTSYSFRVTAQAILRTGTVDSVLASATSAAVSYTHTAPVIPVSPTPTVVSTVAGRAVVSWTAAANATSYTVQYSRNANFAGGGAGTVSVNAPAVTTTINNLRSGSTYYFRITAVNGAVTGLPGTSVTKSIL